MPVSRRSRLLLNVVGCDVIPECNQDDTGESGARIDGECTVGVLAGFLRMVSHPSKESEDSERLASVFILRLGQLV